MRMKRASVFTGVAAALAVSLVVVAAEPTTAPTTKPTRARTAIRLTQPWSKIADLTDEQKSQINAIHVETVEKKKALDQEEDDRCMAILTEAQRTALAETLAEEKAARKKKKD